SHCSSVFLFFNTPPTTLIYTLSLHDALPIYPGFLGQLGPSLLKILPMLDERSRRLVLGMAAEAEGEGGPGRVAALTGASWQTVRSEEHTSELQSLRHLVCRLLLEKKKVDKAR